MLQTHTLSSSEKGLSSVTTLIVGSKAAALIDPPFLIPDAEAVVKWAKTKLSVPLKAIFVTHHHPDHYFSANPILDAFPESQLFAAPYGTSRHPPENIIVEAKVIVQSAQVSTVSTMRK